MAPETDDTTTAETAQPATDAVASPDPAPTYAAPSPGDGPSASSGTSGTSGPASTMQTVQAKTEDHPEYLVGAAFAGGLVLATLLKRLGD
jgi:hypothetical protein